MKMLIELGADVNTMDKNGDTAMHGAAFNISPLVVKLLAERGADPQIWKNPNKAGVHDGDTLTVLRASEVSTFASAESTVRN